LFGLVLIRSNLSRICYAGHLTHGAQLRAAATMARLHTNGTHVASKVSPKAALRGVPSMFDSLGVRVPRTT
jgi:hypothetical protein